MTQKFVDLNNLEHVVEKHNKDVAELRKEFTASIEQVILKGDESSSTFAMRRSNDSQLDSKYNPIGDESGQVYAGVYLDYTGETPEFKFALEIPRGLTGAEGPQGPQGLQGIQGPQGLQGDPYYNRSVMVFCQSETQPAKPNGTWTPATDTIVVNDPLNQVTWLLEQPEEGIIYMSYAYAAITVGDSVYDGISLNFSTPSRITGPQGEVGRDGSTIEFIYKRTETSLVIPSKPNNIKNVDDYVPTGWTDHPMGITEELQCEWMCSRKKLAIPQNGDNWGEWNEYVVDGVAHQGDPTIYCKWGVSGIDGDGIQYVYYANGGEQATISHPSDWEDPNSEYQQKYEEYIPTGWTDDAPQATKTNPCVWMAYRKYNGKDQKWSQFTSPKLWGRYGEDGKNGVSYISRFALVSGSTSLPSAYWKDEYKMYNPSSLPSVWGASARPTGYQAGKDSIWEIKAYVDYKNELAGEEYGISQIGWSDPIIITGVNGMNGEDGNTPNWKTYIYKQSDTKPGQPTFNDPDDVPIDGWMDVPTTEGQWWQCIGLVNGTTGMVESWSSVIPVNGKDGKDGVDGKDGKDGTAQDGKHVEMRFGVGLSAPNVSKSNRNPGSGWSTQPATPNENQYLWMIMATINPDDTMDGEWSSPARISGEQGPKGDTGPTGPQGPGGVNGSDGLPGVSFESEYCLGTETTPTKQWQSTMPTITDTHPYIWMRQGKRVYSSASDTTGNVSWFDANGFRLSGLNGASSDSEARKGQIVYPAGIYNVNTTYETTDRTAPYVMDPADGEFYVLDYVGKWLGTEQNRTPCQDYKDNGGRFWQKFESFEAVYAKVGIIANGLIGSAVFNNEYMFSQQGITTSGAVTTDYEKFNANDPYKSTNEFRPNFCVNFETGEVWTSAGKNYFAKNGSGHLANKHIEWGASGGLMVDGALKHKWANITTPADSSATLYQFIIPNNDLYKVGSNYVPKYNNYKISSVSGFKNILSLPTSDNWDGTELTIMNNGPADLLFGNMLISDADEALGEISTYSTAVTASGSSYGVGPGSLIQVIGVKDHPFSTGTTSSGEGVSWFTTSTGSARQIKPYPLYIQMRYKMGSIIAPNLRGNTMGPWEAETLDQTPLVMAGFLSYYYDVDGPPEYILQLINPDLRAKKEYVSPGANYISKAPTGAGSGIANTSEKTGCFYWDDLKNSAASWLFGSKNIWDNALSGGKLFLDIYIEKRITSSGALTNNPVGGSNYMIKNLYLCNYKSSSDPIGEGISVKPVETTSGLPLSSMYDKTWYRYRFDAKDWGKFVGLDINPKIFSQSFSSKYDPEAASGYGAWIYDAANVNDGVTSLALVAEFTHEISIKFE